MPDSLGPASTPLWWSRHNLTDEYRQFTDYEAEATRISVYQPLVVPGLVQTAAYAAAACAAILAEAPEAEVEARVSTRVHRQQVVEERLARGAGPELVILVDEIVLHRPFGGAAVMSEQLEHLVAQAARAHVTLTVLPTTAGGHGGLGGAFELLEFDSGPELTVAFLESATGDRLLHSPRDTDYYRRAAARLAGQGATGDAAVDLIRRAHARLGSPGHQE